jgi:hypothetical protein
MVDYVRVPLPSLSGRMGVRSGKPIILSEVVVRDSGLTGGLKQVRIQGVNSKGRATVGAWFDLPALDMVDLFVAVVQVAVEVDPKLKDELLPAITRIAALLEA